MDAGRGAGEGGKNRELLDGTEFQLCKMKKPGSRRCRWLYHNTQVTRLVCPTCSKLRR